MTVQQRDIGVVAMECYFPDSFVEQSELERFDGVSAGKYTIGLGQQRLGFCYDNEDICSMALTVVQSLMEKHQISPAQVGRLEVGTETIIDKSKSVKSVLMQLFGDHSDIEGVDTTNACYGGTNALFNSLNWMESSAWDGRYAIVVAGDIAVYASGSARPTGGCGIVALLIGPDAPVVFDRGVRSTHMEHVYDFYKPDLSSEFPEVDGPLTIECYYRAVDKCYGRFIEKAQLVSMDDLDYVCFHCPYTKLVQKSYGRMAFNDFLKNDQHPLRQVSGFEQFVGLDLSSTYHNKEVEKAFVNYTSKLFNERVVPTLYAAKNIGNMYCGSVYFSLASLLTEVDSSLLQGKRVGFFSYGSGLAASMFSARISGDVTNLKQSLSLRSRLEKRSLVSPENFVKCMQLREETHNSRDYKPKSGDSHLAPGSFYLSSVDSKFRRSYQVKQ